MSSARSAGFTLLEVLVALLVLALGILGGTAMQLSALRTRHESALMSQAGNIASALAERMRTNGGLMHAPDGGNPYLSLNYDALAEPDPAPPEPLCYAAGAHCGSAELALFDLYELKMMVRDHLPAGRAVVCRDAGVWAGGRLQWTCSGGASAPLVVKIGWRGKNTDGTPQRDVDGQFAPGVAVVVGMP